MSALKLITPPSVLPITVQQAKDHARIEYHEDDDLVEQYIAQVTALAENKMERAIMPQTWEFSLDSFWVYPHNYVVSPRLYEIRLPKPPLISVTSIKYDDMDGTEQTLDPATYLVDDKSEPARLNPAYLYAWPATYPQPNAVRIRYQCGYPTPDSVPAPIKSWLMARLATFHSFREQLAERQTIALPYDFTDGLLDPYRVYVDVP